MVDAGYATTFAAAQLAGTSVNILEDGSGTTTIAISGATGTQTFAGLTSTAADVLPSISEAGLTSGTDVISITLATTGTNDITGTSFADLFVAGTPTSGTITINGGAGASVTDTFEATSDLSLTGMSSIEAIKLTGDGTDVTLTISATLTASAITAAASVTGNTTASALEYLKIVGSSSADTIDISATTFTNAAASVSGGAGGDVIKLKSNAVNVVAVAATESKATFSGTNTSGTFAGIDSVTGFSLGVTSGTVASDTLNVPGTGAAATAITPVQSTLKVTDADGSGADAVIKSAAISNGIITFDDAASFSTAISLGTVGDVAAALEFLSLSDIGSAGDTVAFVATIDTVAYTYVYTQAGSSAGGDAVELVGVTATSIVTSSSGADGKLLIA